jgi:hypothetical protein
MFSTSRGPPVEGPPDDPLVVEQGAHRAGIFFTCSGS